ncbi:ANK2, partial [Symbiodinium natans]
VPSATCPAGGIASAEVRTLLTSKQPTTAERSRWNGDGKETALDYVARAGIREHLLSAVRAVTREQPEDPLTFLARYLQACGRDAARVDGSAQGQAATASVDRQQSARCLLSQVYVRVCKKSAEMSSSDGDTHLYVMRLVENVCRKAGPPNVGQLQSGVPTTQYTVDESPQSLSAVRRATVSSLMDRAVEEVAPPGFCAATPAASIVATEASFGERAPSPFLGGPAPVLRGEEGTTGAQHLSGYSSPMQESMKEALELLRAGHGLGPRLGLDPLHAAAQHGETEVVSLLLASKAQGDGTSLTTAARFGHAEVVRQLLGSGVGPDASDAGFAALHDAAFEGSQVTAWHTSVVAVLLAARAEVDIAAADGATPLHLAAVAGNDDIVALLVEAGADSALTAGPQQATALRLAASRGHVSVLRALRQQRVESTAVSEPLLGQV